MKKNHKVCVCVCVCFSSMSDPCLLAQEEAAWAQVSLGSAALREARAELAEARKQWHSLQVEIETLHALVMKATSAHITTANSQLNCNRFNISMLSL